MTVSSPPPPPGQQKKLSPLAWVGIGCVAILFVGAICAGACFYFVKGKIDKFAKNPAYNTMEFTLRHNPDVEVLSADEKAGTITVKDKKTGDVVTINTEDFKNGKFSVKTKDGTTNVDVNGGPNGGVNVTSDKGNTSVQFGGGEVKDLPSWVPEYPGGKVQGTLDSTSNGARNLVFTVNSSDGADKLMEFYASKLEAAGLKVEKTTYSASGGSGGTVTGKSDDGKRTMTAMISSGDSGASAIVTVEEKN